MNNRGKANELERTRTVRAPAEVTPAGASITERSPELAADRYRLESEVGEGGIGRVWKARDLRLDRLVAIKCLRLRDDDAAMRFRREAMITAQLAHPSIVPVHDMGTMEGGDPWYAMKLVAGETLLERIARARDAVERMELLPNVIAVAEAVAFAHSERIVHRDLKPANVLVGKFGETVLIDWGLAKRLGDPELEPAAATGASPDATAAGTVLGTPVYMAPEQLRGVADERSDVYALGAMLYHVIAGEPPYRARGADHLRALERGTPPPPLVERVPSTPRELAAVVDKAMAADAAARYPTALELAEDLRRFVAGQLVGAYRYPVGARVVRWLRRNRAPVTVAAVLLAALAATAVVSVRRIVEERNVAEARAEALKLSQARGALERDPTAAVAWLKQVRLSGSAVAAVRAVAEEARGLGVARAVLVGPEQGFAVAWVTPSRLVSGHRDAVVSWDLPSRRPRVVARHAGLVGRIAVAADRRRVASGGHDGIVRVTDLELGESRELGRHQGRILDLLFEDDVAISAGADGRIGVWTPTGGGRWLLGHEGPVNALVIAGARLVSAGADGTVRVWSLEDGEAAVLARHHAEVDALALSPDGAIVYSCGQDGVLRATPVDGGEGRVLVERGERLLALAAAPDGSGLAAGSPAGAVDWIDATGAVRRMGSHIGMTERLAISHDGEWLASVGADSTVRVFGLRSGEARVLRGHVGATNDVAFAPDGSALASVADDGTIRIWPLPRDGTRMVRLGEGVHRLVFDPGGRGVAVATFSGSALVWDGEHAPRTLAGGRSPATVAVAPDGRIAAGWNGGLARLWAWTGEVAGELALGATPLGFDFSPDGTLLAAAGEDGVPRLVTLATGEVRALAAHERALYDVDFDPTGAWLATAGTDSYVTLHDVETGEAQRLEAGGTVFTMAFTPDGARLIAGGEARALRVFDLAAGAVRILEGHTDFVLDVELDAAGRLLASTGSDHTVRLWLASERPERELTVLRGHGDTVFDVAVSPDGTQVASAGRDGMVRVWNVATGSSRLLAGHEGPAKRVAFSPDGTRLASAGDDGTLRLWPARVPELPADAAGLAAWLDAATSAEIVDGDTVRTP